MRIRQVELFESLGQRGGHYISGSKALKEYLQKVASRAPCFIGGYTNLAATLTTSHPSGLCGDRTTAPSLVNVRLLSSSSLLPYLLCRVRGYAIFASFVGGARACL